ncbi:MAG TPA: transposase [bacterium]|nr:transposase [bacterium]
MLGRRIDNKSISALMIDDVDLGNHSAIVAVGITNEGHESLLGLRIGSTKNEQACHDLLSNLVHRGLQHKNGLLVIIGDSKILAKALRDVFGAKVSVQHCQNQQGAF